jgi:hypothetical protein
VPLRDIYEGLQFRPKPKLVQSSQEDRAPRRVQTDLTNGLRPVDVANPGHLMVQHDIPDSPKLSMNSWINRPGSCVGDPDAEHG